VRIATAFLVDACLVTAVNKSFICKIKISLELFSKNGAQDLPGITRYFILPETSNIQNSVE
jgi:hypothetical protein